MSRIPKLPSGRSAEASAVLFAALGDQQRLWLLSRLCDGGPRSITQLASGARISRQAVTKHLRVMERAGLVRSARRGRERMWRLEQRRLEEGRRYLSQISAQWDAVLDRLRVFVEA